MTAEAIEHYNSLLEGSVADDAIEKLCEGTVKYNLRFGDRPVCAVLRPMFVTGRQYEMVRRDATLALSAIGKLHRVLMDDENLRAELGLTPEEERLISIAPGFGAPDASGRLEVSFDSSGEFHFIQYNAAPPPGMLYGDAIGEIFMEMEVVREFARARPLRRVEIRPCVLETLLCCYREWGGRDHPRIAIVAWNESPAMAEFEICRAHMLVKKALFALLDDPQYESLFTGDETKALRRRVPWTRVLREGFTTYRDQRVDLIDFVAGRRETMILKPNDDHGGRGAVFGRQCVNDDWNRAVNEALGASFVVQERVETMQESFPTLSGGQIRFEDRRVDFTPYTWLGDHVEGAGVRLSAPASSNAPACGGSTTPMLILEEDLTMTAGELR